MIASPNDKKKILIYRFAFGRNIDEIEVRIDQYLCQGYLLYGYPFFADNLILQPFIKYAPDDEGSI